MSMCESHSRFLDLATPGVQGLHPYQPGKPVNELQREYGIGAAIKLASNENPLGPSPKALAAARTALDGLARYPDGGGFALKAALAAKHGVTPEAITLGNGSSDVLDLVARAFLTPRHNAVFSEHSFALYPIVTQAVGARAQVAPAQDGRRGVRYGHDLEAMAARVDGATRVVFIANPNNPTGTWLRAAELEGFIAALPPWVIVVVDEAYFEYVEGAEYPDASTWIPRYPNLVVTRTFSKAYGLAGLRVGYGISDAGVAELLNRVRQPFNVNAVALAAAEAALDDAAHLRASIEVNREGLCFLAEAIDEMGLDYIPSVANFLSVDVGSSSGSVYEALLRQGVIVRPVANYGLPHHLRVTVGLAEENRRFIEALGKGLSGRLNAADE